MSQHMALYFDSKAVNSVSDAAGTGLAGVFGGIGVGGIIGGIFGGPAGAVVHLVGAIIGTGAGFG